MYAIGNYVPENTDITIPRSLNGNYGLRAYFARHFHISLDYDTNNIHTYFLSLKESEAEIPAGFVPINLELIEYDFYER